MANGTIKTCIHSQIDLPPRRLRSKKLLFSILSIVSTIEGPSRRRSYPYSPKCVEEEFSEVELPFYGVLRSSRRTIRARCRLPPPNHALLHRATRNFRCSFRPGPGAQAESLYLPFPELSLGDALHAVHWLLAPEQPDRPSYPIARDLLLCQVHADFFRQMVRHERPYLSPAPVGAAPRERGRGYELRIVGEEAHHGVGLPAPPGVFEGERREEL